MMEDGAEGEIGDMLSMCNKHPFFDDDDSERFVILYKICTVFDEPVEGKQPSSAVIVYEELAKSGGYCCRPSKMEESYVKVDQVVQEMAKITSKCAIHLSSHALKNTIQIVRTAFSGEYTQNDKDGNVPEGNEVKFDGDETVMKTTVNCEKLVEDINEFMEEDRQMYGALEIQIMEESERNIDGYAYFSFLKFVPCGNIHLRIPPLEGSCTKEVINEVIETIMRNFWNYCGDS
ncbi:RWD domain-containing protein [Caenorhabditis elegans]|uniref:RWD domain-containing protein n=1 Tax=Caenorhabditis elegans TaxID=6239 RepID=Q9GYU2_CAEEL|nr:RWD domain-containing protein [Caenorhabditis elegans]CCD64819.1 RWD domain-containing protein [Caenorhabditis elegans]|eukprot:NP_503909.1 Uncharacterized protein CELE_F35F10.7 [Caenorhabditis elegans]